MNIRYALYTALLMLISPGARAQEGAHASHGLKPGDELYLHHHYHDIYRTLRKKYGAGENDYHNSCCHNRECRVTLPFKAATPEEEANGYGYRVFVDGKWCPARRDSLVTLSPEMSLRALTDPHVQDFLQKDHVCASYSYLSPHFVGKPFHQDPKSDPDVCPSIHCIIEGGARS
ncbi:MAG: hypothetical protein WAZ27_03045 [Minisyncoccia bacterium]